MVAIMHQKSLLISMRQFWFRILADRVETRFQDFRREWDFSPGANVEIDLRPMAQSNPSFPLAGTIKPAEVRAKLPCSCPKRGHVITHW
jgi:hypothetical protein